MNVAFRRKQVSEAAQQAAFPVPTDNRHLFGEEWHENNRDLKSFWTRTARQRKPEYRLLQQHLSAFQMAEARRTGFVPVIGSDGGRWIVEVYPQQMRMFKLNDFNRATHKCLVFTDDTDMPVLDWAISKILLLEAWEATVERTAL